MYWQNFQIGSIIYLLKTETYIYIYNVCERESVCVCSWRNSPASAPKPPHDWGFTITITHITLGRTPLDEWSAWCIYISTWQNTILTRDIYVPSGIRTRNPSKPAATDPSLRPQSHWDQKVCVYVCVYIYIYMYIYLFNYYLFQFLIHSKHSRVCIHCRHQSVISGSKEYVCKVQNFLILH